MFMKFRPRLEHVSLGPRHLKGSIGLVGIGPSQLQAISKSTQALDLPDIKSSSDEVGSRSCCRPSQAKAARSQPLPRAQSYPTRLRPTIYFFVKQGLSFYISEESLPKLLIHLLWFLRLRFHVFYVNLYQSHQGHVTQASRILNCKYPVHCLSKSDSDQGLHILHSLRVGYVCISYHGWSSVGPTY